MNQVSQKRWFFFLFFVCFFKRSFEIYYYYVNPTAQQNSSKPTLFSNGGANMILDVIIYIMVLFVQYKSQSKWFKLEQSLSPLNAGLRTLTLSIRVEIACSGHIRSGRWTWLQWPLLPGCSWPSDPKTHLLHSTVFQGILTLCCVQSNWRSNFLAGTPKSALCSLHFTVDLDPSFTLHWDTSHTRQTEKLGGQSCWLKKKKTMDNEIPWCGGRIFIQCIGKM